MQDAGCFALTSSQDVVDRIGGFAYVACEGSRNGAAPKHEMNALPDIIRAVSPWAFAGLCVFSYFSGRLLAFMLRRITSGSTSVVFRFAFAVVRAFRLYVSGRDEAAEIQESFARSAMPVYRAM